MIPSIETILRDLMNGRITHADAVALIECHMRLAREAAIAKAGGKA